MAKQLLVFMIFSIVSVSLIAQNNHRNSCNTIKEKRIPRDNFKKSWSVGVFCGLPVVFGDVNVNPKSLGYGFHIQKNFGHSLAIRALYAH